jgi:hypothetical protein
MLVFQNEASHLITNPTNPLENIEEFVRLETAARDAKSAYAD